MRFTPPHLRRAMVPDILDAGVAIFTAQKPAGHANVDLVTAEYDLRRRVVIEWR